MERQREIDFGLAMGSGDGNSGESAEPDEQDFEAYQAGIVEEQEALAQFAASSQAAQGFLSHYRSRVAWGSCFDLATIVFSVHVFLFDFGSIKASIEKGIEEDSKLQSSSLLGRD